MPNWRVSGFRVVKGLIGEGALKPVTLAGDAGLCRAAALGPAAHTEPGAGGAARELRALVAQRGATVALLDGVTGSGKTEVYFEAMAAALAGGQQVLLLVPEIALTQQFLTRVEERFAAEPAAWHSELRPRERERVWRGVGEGRARIVVGARSALFLPWRKLGLIVVDEEHEGAYKQEDGVPYHARDMAIVYGSLGKFPVILSSATPSLETLVNVDRGRYRHVTLKDRHGRPELPRTDLIDMRQAKLERGTWISPALDEAVRGALDAGEQALLFLNRRGFAPLDLVPHLRLSHRMSQLRGSAGRASLPPADAMPSLRVHAAGSAGLSELRRGGDAWFPAGPASSGSPTRRRAAIRKRGSSFSRAICRAAHCCAMRCAMSPRASTI